jgi:hypothetical protein
MGIIDSIIGAESGGDPNARNPNSSASGLGQFVDSTWLDMLARNRPDLITGRSREEQLALRGDPDLSRAMTDAYAKENAQKLTGAGYEATPGNTYLAHFAGPQGALKVLSANPGARAADILGPAVARANPFLASMTAADLRAWADRKMGGSPQNAVAMMQPGSTPPSAPSEAAPSGPMFAAAQPGILGGGNASPGSTGGLLGDLGGQDTPQMSPMPMPMPPRRRQVDLSRLRAMLSAPPQMTGWAV